jgi:filamentous hemagglutinin family protein
VPKQEDIDMFIETRQIFHWRRVFHKGRDFSYCKRLIAGVMMFTASVANVGAEPAGGTVRLGGDATVTIGTHTLIEQRSNRVDIDWTSFNTSATPVRESVTFEQPGTHSLAVNHISGGRTQFDGDLISNGRVFLINQNGITFGESAQVNVGSLLATTSKLDSMVDQPSHDFNSEGYDSIINEGNIIVSDGGFAVLAAPYVKNSGFIKADLGHVELASGNNFTINVDMRGDGLITFAATPEALEDGFGSEDPLGATNTSTGVLQSRSGHVYLTANIASDIVQSVINLDGVVDADQFVSAPNGVEMVASAEVLLYAPRGGTIKVDSVGDINIGMDGGADIHAVHADFDEFGITRPTPFNAEATFHAKRNISVGGAGNPVAITLKANSPAESPMLIPPNSATIAASSTADAEARLEMTAGSTTRRGKGKLTIENTTIEVTAVASNRGGIILEPGDLAASGTNGDGTISAVATAVLQGPDVEINADINVHASADATGMVDGPVANSTDVTVTENGYGPTSADALAVFDVLAIEFIDSGGI